MTKKVTRRDIENPVNWSLRETEYVESLQSAVQSWLISIGIELRNRKVQDSIDVQSMADDGSDPK